MPSMHDHSGPSRRSGSELGGSGSSIEFYCPNGHHIRVPAAWAGKQGPCTKCGAIVRIPGAAANPLEEVSAPLGANPLDDPLGIESGFDQSADGEPSGPTAAGSEWPSHPTADLVARLWAERDHGGTIEVHHADGVIVPDWYDVTWSRGTHGVFGSQAANGTVTITAIAWSSVQKVIVREVRTLPADMFPSAG